MNLRAAETQRLAPLPVLVLFLRALGTADEQIPSDLDAATAEFRSLLAGRCALVVLDNAADAAQVRPLLPAAAGCAALLTSRPQLADLAGVTPMTLDLLPDPDAVELLTRLAGRRRVEAEPEMAARILAHCGLLLALRIAGARLRARPNWPLAAMAEQLEDERRRLRELSIGKLAVRSSFLLSYQALDPPVARTFRLLGLLNGPDVTPDAVVALAGNTTVAADLERLADAQLLETLAPDRYRLHDLIRLFARERAEAEDGFNGSAAGPAP